MRSLLLAALISLISIPASASDVGVSISIGQPGFYGQITLGNHYPVPRLIYPNPVLAMPPAIAIQQQPIYLYVPPGHAKRWNKYCYRYNACHQPVYFVQREWYNDVYVPHYHNQHNHPGGQYYDSQRRYDNHDSDRHRESYGGTQRHPQQNYQDRRRDNDHDHDPSGRGNDKHRGKQDQGQGNHGKKDHERGNRKD